MQAYCSALSLHSLHLRRSRPLTSTGLMSFDAVDSELQALDSEIVPCKIYTRSTIHELEFTLVSLLRPTFGTFSHDTCVNEGRLGRHRRAWQLAWHATFFSLRRTQEAGLCRTYPPQKPSLISR